MTRDELQDITDHDERAGDNLQAAPPAWLHRRLLLDHIRVLDSTAIRIAALLGLKGESLSAIETELHAQLDNRIEIEHEYYSPFHGAQHELPDAVITGWICQHGFNHPPGEVCTHHWGAK